MGGLEQELETLQCCSNTNIHKLYMVNGVGSEYMERMMRDMFDA
jgi:hypothetical protein